MRRWGAPLPLTPSSSASHSSASPIDVNGVLPPTLWRSFLPLIRSDPSFSTFLLPALPSTYVDMTPFLGMQLFWSHVIGIWPGICHTTASPLLSLSHWLCQDVGIWNNDTTSHASAIWMGALELPDWIRLNALSYDLLTVVSRYSSSG